MLVKINNFRDLPCPSGREIDPTRQLNQCGIAGDNSDPV